MVDTSANQTILGSDHTFLGQLLWKRLNPEQWPFQIDDLPKGTVLVGGAVRDGLLNRLRPRPDLDFVVPQDAIQITGALAEKLSGTLVVLDSSRDIARLVLHGWNIDISSQNSQKLEDDLWRRDFRVNAIAMTLSSNPELIDPTGGIEDLSKRQIVAVREQNLLEDPLRLLRAIRLMAELELSLCPETRTFIKLYASFLPKVAAERIQTEVQRIVEIPSADNAIRLLKDSGLLEPWRGDHKTLAQQPPAIKDCNSLSSEEILIALPLGRLTHLFSDSGLEKLKFGRMQRYRCKLLRKWQYLNDGKGFSSLEEVDRLQLHKDLERELPALIVQLPLELQDDWIIRWRNPEDPLFHPSSPLDGNILKKSLGLPEGPKLGELIHHLCHERAFGRLNNREQALRFAHNWLKHN